MPSSPATVRGEAPLALVRDSLEVAQAAQRTVAARGLPPRARVATVGSLPPRAAVIEPPPFSAARDIPSAARQALGAVVLISTLGTVLLAALAASATLAWAGG